MRIVLSWYLYIKNYSIKTASSENYDQKKSRLNTLIMINVQIRHRIERYLVNSCNDVDELRAYNIARVRKSPDNSFNHKEFFKAQNKQ